MKLYICLATALLACSPASSPAPKVATTESAARHPAQDPAPITLASFRAPAAPVLPAGIYTRLHTYRPCRYIDDAKETDAICTEPRFAVLAGIFSDAAAAEKAVRVADELALAPGYPFVAHTEELGIDNPSSTGVAVVLGQFVTRGDAEAWRAATQAHVASEVVGLLDAEAAFALRSDGQPSAVAFRIAGSEAVVAYAEPNANQERCRLPAGAVLQVSEEALSYYEAIAVTCPNGAPVYVRWRDTTLGLTVYPTVGGHQAIQLVGAECDSPLFDTWPYTNDEEQPLAKTTAGGGCGG